MNSQQANSSLPPIGFAGFPGPETAVTGDTEARLVAVDRLANGRDHSQQEGQCMLRWDSDMQGSHKAQWEEI